MKLRLDVLEPNRWNANEVTGDKYLLLVKDMQEAGQREPIIVSPRHLFYGEAGVPDRYVICDGEHRYKAALELGWEELEATVEELTEDEAVTRFYRQQATRGGFDPLREARMFQHYLDDGLTQEQVVKKLGLSSVGYLNDRLALLGLSPLVQEILANLKGMLASRIKERATNETQEEIQELTDEIFARAKITLRQLRPIATLPHPDQGLFVSSMLDTFIDGGTVTKRQVEAMVKDVRERNEALEGFNAAWKAAVTKNCPSCGRPPLLGNWDPARRDAKIFTCVLGHMWRLDLTPEEARVQEEAGKRGRDEAERTRRQAAEETRRAQDAAALTGILADYEEPPTMEQLTREFYRSSDYLDLGDARKAIAQYLEAHPEVTFPGDEPPKGISEQLFDKEVSAALGQPPMPEEETRIAEAWEDEESDEDLEEEAAPDDHLVAEAPAEEPPHVDLDITAKDLHARLVPWVLRKLAELTGVEKVTVEGYRGDAAIKLEYAIPDHKGRTALNYTWETTEPGPVEGIRLVTGWKWFNLVTAATKQGLRVTTLRRDPDMAGICAFIENAPDTGADPWDLEEKAAPEEPTIPVSDHGRGYQEAPDLDAGEEHHEHYEKPEDLPTCPTCGKQSPNSHYCTSCGALFDEKPQEEVAHALTPSEELWDSTGTGKLGGLANALSLEEAMWLRGRETRRRALKHLDRRIAELRLEGAPTITLEED